MAKIIVKHYLNTKLKPHIIDGVLKYPVYVRATFLRQNQRFVSEWINYLISEVEFENDQRIINLCNYEKSIIQYVIESGRKIETINIKSRISQSTRSIVECFIEITLKPKQTKNIIINYITEKTGLTKTIISPYVNFDYMNFNDWILLTQKVDFDDETQKNALFLAMLLEFEEKEYPTKSNEYEVGQIINFYEWEVKNAKTKFVKFAKTKNFINNKDILKIIQNIDNHLIEWFSFDNYA